MYVDHCVDAVELVCKCYLEVKLYIIRSARALHTVIII